MRKITESNKLRAILLDEFAARRERNASYSLRAFARDLELNVTSLSEFFSNKRELSRRSSEATLTKLGIPSFIIGKGNAPESKPVLQLEEDTFKAISDWYYYGILSLARLKGNRASPEWIAQRLGISVLTAKGALERLYRMNLIRKVGNRLYRTGEKITTTNTIPSSAIRHYHKGNLQLAQDALDAVPYDKRFETAITMPANPERLKQAGELIARFREELSDFLEEDSPSEVYTLLIHLFPLTKRKGPPCA